MFIFKSCSVLKDLSFKLLQKIVWQNYFFHIREGRPFETVKFQRSMSVIKNFFSSLIKNTQPLGTKRNPNPAQQVDLKKKSNFGTAYVSFIYLRGTRDPWYSYGVLRYVWMGAVTVFTTQLNPGLVIAFWLYFSGNWLYHNMHSLTSS